MHFETILNFTSEALLLCLLLSVPAVAVAAVVGLLVALVQAVTSIQDQAIGQGVKMVSVTLVLMLTGTWMGSTLVSFLQRLLNAIFA